MQRIEQTQQQTDERVDALETAASGLEHRCAKLEKSHTELTEKYRMAQKATIEREDVESDKFDRPVNLEVIRASARKTVSLAAVQSALEAQPVGSILQVGLPVDQSQVYVSLLGAGAGLGALGAGAGPSLHGHLLPWQGMR